MSLAQGNNTPTRPRVGKKVNNFPKAYSSTAGQIFFFYIIYASLQLKPMSIDTCSLMPVAMTSRTLDAYALEEQRDRLSDPVKWLWLEFNTVFDLFSLAHPYFN